MAVLVGGPCTLRHASAAANKRSCAPTPPHPTHDRSRGVSSPLQLQQPPIAVSSTDSTVPPTRLTTKAWPSSCKITKRKNANQKGATNWKPQKMYAPNGVDQ